MSDAGMFFTILGLALFIFAFIALVASARDNRAWWMYIVLFIGIIFLLIGLYLWMGFGKKKVVE